MITGHRERLVGITDDLRVLVERLKAVSHPLRLRVLALLAPGELGVCQVAETLQVPQSSVSEALKELRRAGFIVERKEGRWVFVSVVPQQELTPFLRGLLTEAGNLPKVLEDRARAKEVQALSLPSVCAKVQTVASMAPEAVRA